MSRKKAAKAKQVVTSSGVADRFLEFAEPLLDAASNQAEADEAMWVAVTAWNMSFYPDDEWRRLIAGAYETATTTGEEVLPLYEELIERRRIEFVGIDCVVTDLEITWAPDDLHLEVVWHPIDADALWDLNAAAPSLRAPEPLIRETPA